MRGPAAVLRKAETLGARPCVDARDVVCGDNLLGERLDGLAAWPHHIIADRKE